MSDSPFAGAMDPEALIAQVERDVLAAEERAASATLLVQQIQQIEAEGKSRAGEATVRVDASGRLVGVRFADSASSLSPTELAAAVMEAAGVAQRKAATVAIQLTEESVGGGLAAQLRGEYESRLGALDDDNSDDGLADGSGGYGERRPD